LFAAVRVPGRNMERRKEKLLIGKSGKVTWKIRGGPQREGRFHAVVNFGTRAIQEKTSSEEHKSDDASRSLKFQITSDKRFDGTNKEGTFTGPRAKQSTVKRGDLGGHPGGAGARRRNPVDVLFVSGLGTVNTTAYDLGDSSE